MSLNAAEQIREEIDRCGPIPFERFMELALYAPGAGYYTRERDPFGRDGDFYTAEQLQPAFGMLIAQLVQPLLAALGARTVVEPGAGRREMAAAFHDFHYVPVDRNDTLPPRIHGVVFANEWFDALPVHLVRRSRRSWQEVYVTAAGEGFAYAPRGRKPSPAVLAYLDRYHPDAAPGSMVDVNLNALQWIDRISAAMDNGYLILIDYGYTAAEWIRHAHGTLLAYHRHTASDDVLSDPGARDITAHVAWTPVEDRLVERGWHIRSFETLARTLLRAGEHDQFASLLAGCDAKEELRRRMQLKTLLFGMGETFRVLQAGKNALPK